MTTQDDRLELFRAGLELSNELAGRPIKTTLRREVQKAADRPPLGQGWNAATGCLCPEHEVPCHRKRRKARRQCSSCIDYCWVEA